jgi:predicted RNase H-like nuclease (RuvC/YqgF family)
MEIPKKLKDEIWEYCRMNDIPNIDEFIIKMVRQGYTVEKFGATPLGTGEVKEIEKVVEVVKEVPVEKIVEVVKEVPVEKVVEKEIYITDDEQVNELKQKLIDTQDESSTYLTNLSEKDKEIDNLKKETKKIQDGFVGMTNKCDNLIKEKSKLEKEIERLNTELEEEKKKNNKGNDIYGDEKKGGWFGSNLLNRR